MEAKPIQNIFLTMATNLFCQGKEFDAMVKYPFDRETLNFAKGAAPRTILFALGDNGLSYDDCQACFDEIKSRLKELGAKITDEMEIRYCCLLSENDEVKAEYILTYPV